MLGSSSAQSSEVYVTGMSSVYAQTNVLARAHLVSCHVMSCHACHEVLNRVLSRSFETEPDSRSRSKGKGLDP